MAASSLNIIIASCDLFVKGRAENLPVQHRNFAINRLRSKGTGDFQRRIRQVKWNNAGHFRACGYEKGQQLKSRDYEKKDLLTK